MAKGFTDIAIRNLQAGETRQEFPDAGCAGLYVIVQPSGKKSFAVRYRFDGKPRKLTLKAGVSLAGARKLAGDALLAVEQGNDPAETKKETRAKLKAAKADTVRALCENYLKREGGKLRTEHDLHFRRCFRRQRPLRFAHSKPAHGSDSLRPVENVVTGRYSNGGGGELCVGPYLSFLR